jgi:uncharacterized protein (TIGR02118 family)
MIHQLIFAHPRPGMSEEDFQRYWVQEHAVRYASRIPQIRRYLIDTRIPSGPEPADPLWSGVAEIWLENEEEQLASLQTPEFLEGARRDEPTWAAFWRTLVLDTDAEVVREGAGMSREFTGVKLFILVKRREGLPLGEFREHSRTAHAGLVTQLPGLRRYLQGFTRDGAYAIGEAPLDAAYQLSFDSPESLAAARTSPEWEQMTKDLHSFVEPRYVHELVTQENWVIGPEAR